MVAFFIELNSEQIPFDLNNYSMFDLYHFVWHESYTLEQTRCLCNTALPERPFKTNLYKKNTTFWPCHVPPFLHILPWLSKVNIWGGNRKTIFLLSPHIFVFYLSLLYVYLTCILIHNSYIKYSLLMYMNMYMHLSVFAHRDMPVGMGACMCVYVWKSPVDVGDLSETFSTFFTETEASSCTENSMTSASLAGHLAPGISFPATEPCNYRWSATLTRHLHVF